MKMLESGAKHNFYIPSIDIQGKHVVVSQDDVLFSCAPGSNLQTPLCTVALAERLVELRRKIFQM